jgi:DNA/RNA endonuclease YhcR with UshA esterase domain
MLVVAFSLFALTAPALKPPVIAPEEAAQHLDQHVIVRGTVSQVVVTKNLTTHLHFGGVYPNQVFTITFFKGSRKQFPGVQDYEGKLVEVDGVVHITRNKPEMVISDRMRLRLADQTPAAK